MLQPLSGSLFGHSSHSRSCLSMAEKGTYFVLFGVCQFCREEILLSTVPESITRRISAVNFTQASFRLTCNGRFPCREHYSVALRTTMWPVKLLGGEGEEGSDRSELYASSSWETRVYLSWMKSPIFEPISDVAQDIFQLRIYKVYGTRSEPSSWWVKHF